MSLITLELYFTAGASTMRGLITLDGSSDEYDKQRVITSLATDYRTSVYQL